MSKYSKYELIKVEQVSEGVLSVQLNRPQQQNVLNFAIWKDINDIFLEIDEDPEVRVVILSANGPSFASGLDFDDVNKAFADLALLDTARKSRKIFKQIEGMQQAFTNIEKCSKPVIAAVHGNCHGGGVGMVASCDIRFSTADAQFAVKDVAVGIASDVGSLNRLPKIVGNHGWLREIAFTARNVDGDEAQRFGLVSRVFKDKTALLQAAKASETAETIAAHSPVAIQGTKHLLNHARDHSVDESLRYTALWNSSQLQTDDLAASVTALHTKTKPVFANV